MLSGSFTPLRLKQLLRRPMTLDASPPFLPGLPAPLDRSLFRKSIPILAARFPATKLGSVRKSEPMRRSVLDIPRLRTVIPNPSNPTGDRLVLLKVSSEEDLSSEALEFLKTESNGLIPYTLELGYDHWTADEIIQAILPEALRERSPVGFSMTGHIAHINLNNDYLPYKHQIGQILLDKNASIRTVVNKLDMIDTQFRFFKMELLAGDPDYIVEHSESDCRFTFDFTQVYWNSRLHTEHERLVQLFDPEDVVADVFAGVGPFAIPAAKKGCAVLANDLNPQSAKYLAVNVENNRVGAVFLPLVYSDANERLPTSSGCRARTDVHSSLRPRPASSQEPFPPYSGPKLSKSQENKERRKQRSAAKQTDDTPAAPRAKISHFVMNLPDSAIEFLDAFRGIFSSMAQQDVANIYSTMPMIHCHCFTRELEPEKAQVDILKRVEEKIGHPLDDFSLHMVRSVAPNKDMYCISFRLPEKVAFK
ncbi:Met-10+ like-protein-domain-containing protein [Mycena metata]|uniref:tRNA (guanine(37)-N1)-methyltransferase n=1 Tax=Mycena metata TaxID=1033252 RepID=A0AAD7KJY9_9AGAR|nr:Met-10+ like-protein-domain-containing protein [Mycena metata]